MSDDRKEGMMKRRDTKQSSTKSRTFERCFYAFLVAICCMGAVGCEATDHAVVLGAKDSGEIIKENETDPRAWADSTDSADQVKVDEEVLNEAEITEEPLYVHVCGMVAKPGVYELSAGSRKCDAIDAAGGFLEGADTDYINLAKGAEDGEQIYVPAKGEVTKTLSAQGENETKKSDDHVNLNTADEAALCTLPGIGATRAKKIIAYREEHGGFHAVKDILNVSGIKESVFEQIRELVTVD